MTDLEKNIKNCSDVLKEPTINCLIKTIKAIYGCEYSVSLNVTRKYIVYVDPSILSKKEKIIIDDFQKKNNLFEFVFSVRDVNNNCSYI